MVIHNNNHVFYRQLQVDQYTDANLLNQMSVEQSIYFPTQKQRYNETTPPAHLLFDLEST
jgi:hypothetical protein